MNCEFCNREFIKKSIRRIVIWRISRAASGQWINAYMNTIRSFLKINPSKASKAKGEV